MKTLRLLQSSDAVLAVLILALLAQMPHAQHVFYELSRDLGWFGWVQSWFAAIALEFAVLVFVVRGKTIESWGFAVFSVAINLVYYYSPEIVWYLPKSTWLLSAGLPVAIALYSHEVAGKHQASAIVESVNTATDDVNTATYNANDLDLMVDALLTPVNQAEETVDLAVDTVDIASRACQLLGEYDNDKALVTIALVNEGYKQVDIAGALGVHKTQVSRWVKKEKANA